MEDFPFLHYMDNCSIDFFLNQQLFLYQNFLNKVMHGNKKNMVNANVMGGMPVSVRQFHMSNLNPQMVVLGLGDLGGD